MGAVKGPGPYNIKPGWRLTEAISAAGGIPLGLEPADCTINILRGATGSKQSVPLQEAMRGNESSNLAVQPGDVITVEAVELIPVYVMGKVSRTGVYNIRKDSAGVLEAITMAGGTLDDAALTKVTVTHLNGTSETVSIVPATLEGKQESPIKLRSGDLLVVPDSTARFAVLGWVNAPGFFPLKENQEITLSDALGLARGTDNKRSGLRRIAVVRNVDGKQERLVYDFEKFARKGDMTQNPVIRPGDMVWVPETDNLDWDRILSRISGSLSLLWTADRFRSR
jgi:polysaccharide export outer membrane protein